MHPYANLETSLLLRRFLLLTSGYAGAVGVTHWRDLCYTYFSDNMHNQQWKPLKCFRSPTLKNVQESESLVYQNHQIALTSAPSEA